MKNRFCISLILLVVFLLSACQGGAPAPTATSTSAPTDTPAPTSTPAPTATPILRSGSGNEAVTLMFINKSSETLKITWVNFDGLEEDWGEVAAASSLSADTYNTHAWRVRDSAGNLIGEVIATSEKSQAYEIGQDKTLVATAVATPVPVAALGERSYYDRPDDAPGLYQVHLLYILPPTPRITSVIWMERSISQSNLEMIGFTNSRVARNFASTLIRANWISPISSWI